MVYRCDGCGREMKRHDLRYVATIEIHAAYDEMEVGLADLVRDHRSEIAHLLEKLRHRDPKEIEEQVYKRIETDLCPSCHQAFVRDPLRFHPEQGGVDKEINMDGFLKSLGMGKPRDEEDEA